MFFNVSSLYDLPKSEGMIRVLVVDLFKAEEECSYDDWEYLLDLHEKDHYAIIFVGDNSADKAFLYNYIDPSSNTSMIVLFFDEDNVSSTIHHVGETNSKAIVTYQILRQIEDIVEYEPQRE